MAVAWREYLSAQNRRDLWELVLLPGIALFLPWRWAFRIFRWAAFHLPSLYQPAVETAFEQARQRQRTGSSPQEAHWWQAQRRLVTLVDHADLYLSLRHGPRFLARHLDVQGQWPAPEQAGISCTFHWGAGMWGLYHARQHGLRTVALIAPLDKKSPYFQGRPVLYRYTLARVQQVIKALQQQPVDVSKSLRPVLKTLARGEQVLFLADVPADQASTSLPVWLGPETIHVPRGMLKLAVEQRIPVTFYIVGINLLTGRRFLRIEPLGIFASEEAMAQALFTRFNGLLDEQNVAWHLWSEMPRFTQG